MTATNPHPLANPYNTRRYCNFNVNKALNNSYIKFSKNPNMLSVPQSQYSYEDIINYQKSLTVPYQDDLPNGDTTGGMGFLNNSLFRCADGSIINTNTKKIIHDPNSPYKQNGYWTNPNEQMAHKSDATWEDTPSIASILNNVDKYDNYDPNLSQYDMQYWEHANKESKKLEQTMTHDQKQMMDQLNNGEFFKLSKLVLEH